MTSVVTLRTYWRDSGKIFEGCGLKVNDFILTHYRSLGVESNEVLKYSSQGFSSLPLDVYLVQGISRFVCRKISLGSKKPLTIIQVWHCKSFEQFFNKYFNSDDFGDKSVRFSATFILLGLNDEVDHVNVQEVLFEMESSVPMESNVTQGMNVLLMDGKSPLIPEKFSKTNYQGNQARCHQYSNRKTGIVSYTFDCGLFFTIDLAITRGQEGSLLCRYLGGNETGNYFGMVIFKDILPHPFEVFPLCISLKHILSDLCHVYQCSLTSSQFITTKHNNLSYNPLKAEYLFLLQCGSNVGSGILVSDGVILTCSHILAEQTKYGVTVYNKEGVYRAEVLYKPSHRGWPDLALIQLTSSYSCPSTVVFSDEHPVIGEKVLAVGIPYVKGWYKNDPWISLGHLISADKNGHLIASSAVHNGFSGGCILDMKGHMIGMICSKAFPLNPKSTVPLRLTQIIPMLIVKEHIMQFISSARTQNDVQHFDKKLQESRKVNLLSRL